MQRINELLARAGGSQPTDAPPKRTLFGHGVNVSTSELLASYRGPGREQLLAAAERKGVVPAGSAAAADAGAGWEQLAAHARLFDGVGDGNPAAIAMLHQTLGLAPSHAGAAGVDLTALAMPSIDPALLAPEVQQGLLARAARGEDVRLPLALAAGSMPTASSGVHPLLAALAALQASAPAAAAAQPVPEAAAAVAEAPVVADAVAGAGSAVNVAAADVVVGSDAAAAAHVAQPASVDQLNHFLGDSFDLLSQAPHDVRMGVLAHTVDALAAADAGPDVEGLLTHRVLTGAPADVAPALAAAIATVDARMGGDSAVATAVADAAPHMQQVAHDVAAARPVTATLAHDVPLLARALAGHI